MATGDVTISVAVEGGVTKSVVLASATRVLSRAQVVRYSSLIDNDAKWQVHEVNNLASQIVDAANDQAQTAATPTPLTFTAAS